MENTKVYLGLFAVWGMVAWVAWEFAWDAWQNARRNKRQRQPPLDCQPPHSPEPTNGEGVEPARNDKLAV